MTTYRFKRSEKKSITNAGFINYVPFVVFTFLALILNTINIPYFFGGSYHIFLFEFFLFYIIFVKQYKKYLITIFIFYAVLDITEEITIGISFLSFIVSLFILNGFFIFTKTKLKPNAIGSQTIYLFLFVLIFAFTKLFLIYIFNDFEISKQIIFFLIKSIFYSCFLFFNLQLFMNLHKVLRA